MANFINFQVEDLEDYWFRNVAVPRANRLASYIIDSQSDQLSWTT